MATGKTMELGEQLHHNAQLGARNVGHYLSGDPVSDTKIRVSLAAVIQYNRFKATQGAFLQLGFIIQKAIYDEKELKKVAVVPQIPE